MIRLTSFTAVVRGAARGASLGAVLALAALLTGCALSPADRPSRDPFERYNRGMSEFNENVDSVVLKPVATAYKQVTPPLVRTGVSNFFGNIQDAWSFVNATLQFKFQFAMDNLVRVHINTMFGLGGILDVASELNIDRHNEDFGQTLGNWGVPAGPYVVLPLLGPSTLRDVVALPVDRRFDLLKQVDPSGARNSLYTLRVVEARSNLLRASLVLDEAALDKYSFTRDVYLQRRRAELFDGNPPDGPAMRPSTPR